MPRGDRTGPAGMGPMTGRGAGLCTGSDAPGFMNPGGGRGFGSGRRGHRNRYYATGLPGWQRGGWSGYSNQPQTADMAPAQEIDLLKSEAEYLKQSLDGINQRLQDLEKEKKQENDS